MCAHYEPPPPTRPRLENDTVMRFMPQRRLRSLDAFRGLTIAAMVLVNNPGTWAAVYAPLTHARWHGLTPTDVIFPFFLFIVGVAIPLSRPTVGRVLRRAAIIFALGLVLNGLPRFDWATIRIPGVLQRIAVCYLVAALLFLTTGWRTQAIVTAALLLGYWGAMTLVPVPGYGRGNLGPEGNLAAWLDRAVLGPHIWRAARVYDPEGILSTVLGAAWGVWFPVNKALWTSSYVVLTAGLALLVLAACYWAIEIRGWRRWAAPFVVLGVNALALFFLSTLVAHVLTLIRVGNITLHTLIFERVFVPWASPINASLAYAAAYVLVWWGAMWLLYRAGVRLRA